MDGLTCIKQFEIREDYYYAGVKVVSCHIFYPQFIGHHPALDALNNKYYLQASKRKTIVQMYYILMLFKLCCKVQRHFLMR